MNRSLYALPAVLCLTAAIVTAQAPAGEKPAGDQPRAQEPATPRPTTPPAAPSTPPASSQSAAGKVTYTGCLKQGESAGAWILENAEAAAKPGAAPSAVGTSGASKTTFSLDAAVVRQLDAARQSQGRGCRHGSSRQTRRWRDCTQAGNQCRFLEDGLGDLSVRSTASAGRGSAPRPAIPRHSTRAVPALHAAPWGVSRTLP